MNIHLCAFNYDDEQIGVTVDHSESGCWSATGMSRWLSNLNVERVEVRDDEGRVRGIARPPINRG